MPDTNVSQFDQEEQNITNNPMLDQLSEANRAATAEYPDGKTRFELYVIPEPDGTEYQVIVLTSDGSLHHLSSFDIATLEGTV